MTYRIPWHGRHDECGDQAIDTITATDYDGDDVDPYIVLGFAIGGKCRNLA